MIVLTVLGWLVVALVGLTLLMWISRHFEISRAVQSEPPLRPDMFPPPPPPPQADPDAWPMISVLVAAKDEEAVIEKCLRSMLAQDYPNLEVILIDDRSGDRTGAIGQAVAAEDPRLRVLHVTELADGWFGKNNAMRAGMAAARGRWLCFIDADCTQTSRSTLSAAIQFARERGAKFLSVLPRLVAHGFWEQAVQPVCGGILVFWFKPAKVNDAAHRAAYANGAFMLIETDAYWSIGGHEAVKSEMNEDIQLAARAKAAGVPLRVVQNDGLYVTRMYDGFAATWRGWSRIFYGSFLRRRRLAISLAMMFTMGVLAYATLAGGLIGLALAAGPAGPLAWAATLVAAATIAVQQTVLFRFYPLAGIGRRFTPTYFLGAVVACGIIANAMRKVGGRSPIVWRGTTYAGNRRVG